MKSKILFLIPFAALLMLVASPACAEITDAQFEEAMKKYLGSAKGQEAVGSSAEKYFQKKQQEQAKNRKKREAASMEEQFKNPVKIEVGNSPFKGPKDAKVTIIEFTDFQCPYCSKGANTMEEVLKAYPKDVRVVLKNLPLPFHKQAGPAAKAALAAGKQGKYWEMHDALFKNQRKLNEAFYLKTAGDLGLDVDKFTKDMADPAFEKQIKEDMEVAKKNGISGTPGFFVNGVAVKGAYPFDHFKTIIDRWLAEGTKKS